MNRKEIIKKRNESNKKLIESYSKKDLKVLIKEGGKFLTELKGCAKMIPRVKKDLKKFNKRLKILEGGVKS